MQPRCAYPWQQMVIDLSGEVSPCCFWRGYGGDALPLGQARQASLVDIWNGEPWRRLRHDLSHGRLTGYPCATCLSTQWNGGDPPP
ncbi:MAG TPA: SPASM domain-containing protein, partial [Candidatus Ozemobacteraceae bacterium]|nr:SPASM domain-containing protein [Candidatus Ozemobacteraceae bacterium]